MNSPLEKKLIGINAWFIIEILSFYGYILAAVFFIFERIILSSIGMIDKQNTKLKIVYMFDFVSYYKKDLDWLAFVTILTVVNFMI